MTCFLFVESFDDEQFLSLRLDQDGQVDAPLVHRSIEALKTLQQGTRTIVVLPAGRAGLYRLELPWLGERKARAAIPFALEEQLAQNVTSLHFAFDKNHYQHNHYLVTVIDKIFLADLISKLDTAGIHFDRITLDWFALHENEACVTERGLLVNDDFFRGALSKELAVLYLKDHSKNTSLLCFPDSMPIKKGLSPTVIDESLFVWFAKRLLQTKPMNLCQGELQHDTKLQSSLYWYKISGTVAGALLTSVILFNALYIHFLNANIAELDKKIGVIYRQFFPGAAHVINPKFRIGQLLKGFDTNSATASLWTLLDRLSQAFISNEYTLEQLRFQSQVLSVTLMSKDFADLERLQQRLQQANVKVSQIQASSQGNQVKAILELSL